MTEIIGICKSVDNINMIIVDDDNDEIEISLEGLHIGDTNDRLGKQVISYYQSLIGKRISFFYDRKGILIRELNNEQMYVYGIDGQKRTPETALVDPWKNISQFPCGHMGIITFKKK